MTVADTRWVESQQADSKPMGESERVSVPTHCSCLQPISLPSHNSIPSFIYPPLPSFLSTSTATSITNSFFLCRHCSKMFLHHFLFSFIILSFSATSSVAATTIVNPKKQTLNTQGGGFFNPKLPPRTLSSSKKFEGSSNLVDLRYHMGPVLSSSPINIYLIWYGRWSVSQKLLIKDFITSISPSTKPSSSSPSPSVSEWWKTVSLYTDQTGANVSRTVVIAKEHSDMRYSHGSQLTRLSIQQVIATAVKTAPFPVDHRNGIYLILTSHDVTVQDFCRAVCGFHYFTFPSMVGYTLPYAWIGNSGKQCPEVCAYPFAVPGYMAGGGPGALAPPNGDVGLDGMISVIAHELAELATNPLVNAWYAGEDPTSPTEIGDLCEGLYGTGGGGGYIGQVMRDGKGKTYNVNGNNGRKFLVQWIWSPVLKACAGPNALD
ncbi:protein EXORDIUM-like 5 [Durio zibethinus]|uniref:Protein EXORDIUM-like 5 n=1 Tax=Durio zibethinus TaxID=66656 RepID=A0A6P6AB73_DURZI|nr:protein EXORDIUM-like 5 [Durio zibethinus]